MNWKGIKQMVNCFLDYFSQPMSALLVGKGTVIMKYDDSFLQLLLMKTFTIKTVTV